jgi:hypothetical protein
MSSRSSQSDASSVPSQSYSAIHTRSCRQRIAQGQAVRSYAPRIPIPTLLAQPYHQLNRFQQRRVRQYRQQHGLESSVTSSQYIQHEQQSSQSQSDYHAQQQAQLVASRVTSTSHMPTIPPFISSPSMDMMSPSHQPSTGVNLMPPPSSIPTFIPVAMIPSSYFPTMFPHVTTPSTIPVVFSSHTQPIQSTVVHHVQPVTASLSIMNQSDVDSPPVPQTSQQSSVTSSEMSSTPARILVGMSGQEQTSTSTPLKQTTTTSSSVPIPPNTEELFGDEPYLVHPPKQALAQTKLSWQASTNSSQPQSTSSVDPQQSDVYATLLHKLVLLPKQRFKYMHQVNNGKQGQYLNHWDMDNKQDNGDIFSDILATPENTSSSTSTSTRSTAASSDDPRIDHLRHVLPFKLSTHTQAVFKQQLVDSKPTFQSTTYKKHSDAYTNLLRAHDLHTSALKQPHTIPHITIEPSHHVFAPSIALNSINNPSIQQHLQAIAQTTQTHYQRHVKQLSSEVMCDHVFTPALDGFGILGLQLYFKNGYCIAWIHDELLWTSALNYMTKNSVGCALWIGIGLHDLKQKMHMMEIDDWFKRDQPDIMKIGELLDALIASNTRVEYLYQHPGNMVSSPPGMGAAHLVITYGLFMTQLAWNFSFTLNDSITCLSFWGEQRTDRQFGHLYTNNGSMATRTTLPLYTMEGFGYPLNLTDDMMSYKSKIQHLQQRKHKVSVKIMTINDKHLSYCPDCLYRQDWIRVNNQCVHCYFKKPNILKLLQ